MKQICKVRCEELLNASDLLAEYAAECSIAEIGEVCPQAGTYAALERAGIVQMFGAYLDGELVGFASVILSILPHYGKKVATLESLFVGSAARSSGVGGELMNTVEDHALKAGCVAVLYSAPAGGTLERLLSLRKAYRRTNSVFCRSL